MSTNARTLSGSIRSACICGIATANSRSAKPSIVFSLYGRSLSYSLPPQPQQFDLTVERNAFFQLRGNENQRNYPPELCLVLREYHLPKRVLFPVHRFPGSSTLDMRSSVCSEEKEVCSELPRRWEWCFLLTDRLRTCSILAFMW